jgi:RNA polymerase sigma-70 factor (ECF subfamily)
LSYFATGGHVTDLRNSAQFDRAYRRHAPQMLAAANRVLRNPAAAEDVVQDVFMQLWRNPGAYDARRGALGSYLTMMARSRALDRWRTRAARDAAVERSKQEQRVESATGESAADRVLRRDGEQRMLRALDELPGDQREAVLLAFGRGLTAREIATAADVPLGTAKSRVRLGLERARTSLGSSKAAA